MSTAGANEAKQLDVSVTTATVWFFVGNAVSGTVEATARGDTWTVGILSILQSQNPWGGVDTGLTLGPGNDITDPFDFQAAWVGVRVSATVEAASEIVDVTVHAKREA